MKHQCPKCESWFVRPYRLAQHLLTHANLRAFVCPEKGCLKSYTSKSHLDRHINSVHKQLETDVIYSCPFCLKTYSNRQNLKRHINVSHKYQKPICDICKTEFKKKHQIIAHMYIHTGVKSFSCNICSKEFVCLSEKKKHMRYHKSYKCEECESVFNYWSTYLKHRREVHQSTELTCEECGKCFDHKSHMVRHLNMHATINDTRVFPCTYENCDRSYSRNSNLTQHILAKHERLVRECHICHAQLSYEVTLRKHLKLHERGLIQRSTTNKTSRKTRKDKGTIKTTTALKLAGLFNIYASMAYTDNDNSSASNHDYDGST